MLKQMVCNSQENNSSNTNDTKLQHPQQQQHRCKQHTMAMTAMQATQNCNTIANANTNGIQHPQQ
ncbi:hypothetical protein CVT25_004714 [Psilocybe cyanescens]|uniref:Uncharacterized protein n=1 Tax=Psilocybe cyanescens TaxID=93625 RepID=A0A409XIT6_PSICY|nr:hypothetical protein CVT25_004714 [Psilocybe cyanescens]